MLINHWQMTTCDQWTMYCVFYTYLCNRKKNNNILQLDYIQKFKKNPLLVHYWQPSRLLENWIGEFLSHVKRCRPEFIALHLQEVGGKTYEKSMEYVQQFIKILCESKELNEYNKIRVFLDEDYHSAEHFTVS